MNRVVFILSVFILSVSCSKNEVTFVGIEDISFENYPKVDGSTSAEC